MKPENLNAVTKGLDYYENLPYTFTIRRDEDGDFVATVQELPGCMAHGASEAAALEEIRNMKRLWIETALEAGQVIPEPEDEPELPSGKWVQRVPRKLHRDLVRLAQQENVSLNQLVTSMLSEQVTFKSCLHAMRTCVADALTVRGATEPPTVSYWMLQEQQSWECTVHASPSGGLIQALSRVEKIALPWGRKQLTAGHKWWAGRFDNELTKDYIQEHANSAKR